MGILCGYLRVPGVFSWGLSAARKRMGAVIQENRNRKAQAGRLDINKEKELCPQDIN